jgi:hypothetical protein
VWRSITRTAVYRPRCFVFAVLFLHDED